MNRKESKKKWRQANAERLRIYQRNYRATHREEGRKYMQKYSARKREMMVGEGDNIIQQVMEASSTDLIMSQPFVQEVVSNRSGLLPDLSTSQIPETFDWFEDIIDNSANHSVLISEIKSCPSMERNIADVKAELALLEDNNFFLID